METKSQRADEINTLSRKMYSSFTEPTKMLITCSQSSEINCVGGRNSG